MNYHSDSAQQTLRPQLNWAADRRSSGPGTWLWLGSHLLFVCSLESQTGGEAGIQSAFWGGTECKRANRSASPLEASPQVAKLTPPWPKQFMWPDPQARVTEGHSICHEAMERPWIHNCITGEWTSELRNSSYHKNLAVNNASKTVIK